VCFREIRGKKQFVAVAYPPRIIKSVVNSSRCY
jgi:hypothetical protein